MDVATSSPSKSTVAERRRRSVEEGRALIAAWQASGLSQHAFAAERGVRKQRIGYWRVDVLTAGA